MAQYSKVEIDGRLLIVTINRPEVYNALHPMANQELSDAFDEFAANSDLWVAIITGAGKLRPRASAASPTVMISTNRSSPRSTVSPWAAVSRSRLPPTSSLPPTRRGSPCPSRA